MQLIIDMRVCCLRGREDPITYITARKHIYIYIYVYLAACLPQRGTDSQQVIEASCLVKTLHIQRRSKTQMPDWRHSQTWLAQKTYAWSCRAAHQKMHHEYLYMTAMLWPEQLQHRQHAKRFIIHTQPEPHAISLHDNNVMA